MLTTIMKFLILKMLYFLKVCLIFVGRGLILPDSGGNVKMRAFLDSLSLQGTQYRAAFFACLDLLFLATLVDQLLGFKQGSILHSSNNVNGMNADWPLAADFYVYQNGL